MKVDLVFVEHKPWCPVRNTVARTIIDGEPHPTCDVCSPKCAWCGGEGFCFLKKDGEQLTPRCHECAKPYNQALKKTLLEGMAEWVLQTVHES